MTSPIESKRSIWRRLYHGETSFDFVGRKRLWFLLSGIVILIGLISLFTRGLNFGIDFEGGTAWQAKLSRSVTVDEARDAIALPDAKVQILRSSQGRNVLIQDDLGDPDRPRVQERKEDVTEAVAKLAGIPRTQVAVNDVGPSWGEAVTEKAVRALVFFFIVIAAYISFRFEWKMAVAALSAVVHDIFVTVGVYSVSGFEVTPATVIAFLTILGYSLYDTIVVFDKVEENTRGLAATGRFTYSDTVNISMNQVLMRSLNTSLVAILPILSVLIVGAGLLGAVTLKDFGLALVIGLLTGAYSSIYIASPILAVLKEHEPRYASIRQRLATRGVSAAPLTPAAVAATAAGGASPDGGERPAPPLRPGAGRVAPVNRPATGRPPPRPRKKKRR